MTDQNKTTKEIPEFKSYEEEAEWWDTHSALDYLDPTFKPIVSQGNKQATSVYLTETQPSQTINVRFSGEDLAKIRDLADYKGVGPTTLIRMWALEKLREEKQHKQSA